MSGTQHADLSALRINRDSSKPERNFPWKGIIALVVVALLGFFGYSWFSSSSLNAVEVEMVVASTTSSSAQNAVLTASGYVVAQRKAAVSSKTSGKLVQLAVIEGDEVYQGQVIGRIESADVEAQLAQQRASLQVAQADLANALAEQDEAKRELDRLEPLGKSGAVPQQQVDVAQSRLQKAHAMVNARRASISMNEANIRNAQVQVENTVIRAPFDGTVLTKNANVGEVITALGASAGSRGAVVTLADMTSLEVEADVSESNIQKITPNQPCEITLNAYADKRYTGYLSKIIPTADRSKATVQVKVRFTNKDDNVLPEMGAKVLFLSPESANTKEEAPKLMVPISCVVQRNGSKVCFVVDGDKVKQVPVSTGIVKDSFVEILSGVADGNKLVANPAESLKDGSTVKQKQ